MHEFLCIFVNCNRIMSSLAVIPLQQGLHGVDLYGLPDCIYFGSYSISRIQFHRIHCTWFRFDKLTRLAEQKRKFEFFRGPRYVSGRKWNKLKYQNASEAFCTKFSPNGNFFGIWPLPSNPQIRSAFCLVLKTDERNGSHTDIQVLKGAPSSHGPYSPFKML